VIRKAEVLYPDNEKARCASPHFPGADRLLTINEVSALTGLAVGTLYHFVCQKRIPVVRLSKRCIRFRLSSLERWFEDLDERDIG
jgi:excisionase family DNA binding protein